MSPQLLAATPVGTAEYRELGSGPTEDPFRHSPSESTATTRGDAGIRARHVALEPVHGLQSTDMQAAVEEIVRLLLAPRAAAASGGSRKRRRPAAADTSASSSTTVFSETDRAAAYTAPSGPDLPSQSRPASPMSASAGWMEVAGGGPGVFGPLDAALGEDALCASSMANGSSPPSLDELLGELGGWGASLLGPGGALQSLGPDGPGDHAYWYPKANPEETIAPGDVVGVVRGRITLRTDGAPLLMVVPQRPVIECRVPRAADRHLHGRVAYIGQARVRLAPGQTARADDLLLPSGRCDGTAVVLGASQAAAADPALLARVVGRALEDASTAGAEGGGAVFVSAAVCLSGGFTAEFVAALQRRVRSRRLHCRY